jgi:hypothetical protein
MPASVDRILPKTAKAWHSGGEVILVRRHLSPVMTRKHPATGSGSRDDRVIDALEEEDNIDSLEESCPATKTTEKRG